MEPNYYEQNIPKNYYNLQNNQINNKYDGYKFAKEIRDQGLIFLNNILT